MTFQFDITDLIFCCVLTSIVTFCCAAMLSVWQENRNKRRLLVKVGGFIGRRIDRPREMTQ